MTNQKDGNHGKFSETLRGAKPDGGENNPPIEHGALGEALHEIKRPDAFQDALVHFWDFIETHSKTFALILLVAALAGIGSVGYGHFARKREKKAFEALSEISTALEKKEGDFRRARYAKSHPEKEKPESKDGKTPAAKPEEKLPTGDITADYGDLVTKLEAFAKEKSGTSASVYSSLQLARIYREYGKHDDAIRASASALAGANKKGELLEALAGLAYGSALADGGHCDQAIPVFEKVLAEKVMESLKSEAALRAGLCLEKTNFQSRALELFQKAAASGEGPTQKLARGLARRQEVAMAAPAAAPTTAAPGAKSAPHP